MRAYTVADKIRQMMNAKFKLDSISPVTESLKGGQPILASFKVCYQGTNLVVRVEETDE